MSTDRLIALAQPTLADPICLHIVVGALLPKTTAFLPKAGCSPSFLQTSVLAAPIDGNFGSLWTFAMDF